MKSKESIWENVHKWDNFKNYEKSPLWKKYEGYQNNLLCLQDVTDRFLTNMKGLGISFKPEITDEKKQFSQERLSGFVEELLSRWAAKQREGTFTDPSTGESMAEPYIRARQELYGCYLYLVMRCSLCNGGYVLTAGGEKKERTDFAFLLEEAKAFLRGWCVMEYQDGNKINEQFWGFDNRFGFHLYSVLLGVAGISFPGSMPLDHPAFLTDEGSVKRNQLKEIYLGHMPASLLKKAEEEAQQDEEDMAGDSDGDEDGYDIGHGYDMEEDYDIEDSYNKEDYEGDYDDAFSYDELLPPGYDADAEFEYGQEQAQKLYELDLLTQFFEYKEEYVRKCDRFLELFKQAKPDVLRGFCEDLEEIVTLYLAERDIPPLTDTDKALDVYGRIYDGPGRQAERYGRGIQWKNL